MKTAYIDESNRPGKYLLCGASIAEHNKQPIRHDLRQLVLPGQTRLHFGNEKDRQTIASVLRAEAATTLRYGHTQPSVEPMVWIPDAIAWTHGKDGNWRKELARLGLITETFTLD